MQGIWRVAFRIQWVLLAGMAYALVVMMRNFGALYDAVNRVRIGEPETIKLVPGQVPPTLALTDLAQHPVARDHVTGAPLTLSVISPGCGPCKSLLDELASSPTAHHRHALLSVGSAQETAEALTALPGLHLPVMLTDYAALKEAWGITGTPTIVELDADGAFVAHTVGFTPQRERAVAA